MARRWRRHTKYVSTPQFYPPGMDEYFTICSTESNVPATDVTYCWSGTKTAGTWTLYWEAEYICGWGRLVHWLRSNICAALRRFVGKAG